MSDEMYQALLTKLCTIEKLLTGNGEPERGLVVRMDRVEQRLQLSSKVFWLVLSVVVAPEIFLAVCYLLGNK